MDAEASLVAVSSLCEAYWYPLYAYFRRAGKSSHDAEDLTQGFFARMLERKMLSSATPEKGRLRTFLLACAHNHMTDEWSRGMAQKRGAGLVTAFDLQAAEARYGQEDTEQLSPDRLFQRQWALGILDRSLRMLADEYRASPGQIELFEALRPFLGFGGGAEQTYEEIAVRLQTPVGTLKNKVFRLRQRWRELLFDQVGRTLADPTPEEIKDELSELLGAV